MELCAAGWLALDGWLHLPGALPSTCKPAHAPVTPGCPPDPHRNLRLFLFLPCRSTKQYPEAEPQPNVLILRIDAPIWFANVEVSWRAPCSCAAVLA